jgi:hypothetical protein
LKQEGAFFDNEVTIVSADLSQPGFYVAALPIHFFSPNFFITFTYMGVSLGMNYANYRNPADYYLLMEVGNSSILKSDVSIPA